MARSCGRRCTPRSIRYRAAARSHPAGERWPVIERPPERGSHENQCERHGSKGEQMMRAGLVSAAVLVVAGISIDGARQPGGPAAAAVSGELRQWHKVTLTFNGPQA